MNELLFPLCGALLVLFVVLPLLSGLSKLLLLGLERFGDAPLSRWTGARYLLLVLPALLPVVWAVSAGLHQAESGRSVLACLLSHDLGQLCVEPLLFVGILLGLVAARVIPLRGSLGLTLAGRAGSAEVARIERLLRDTPALAELHGRILVVDDEVGGCATTGLLRPVVVVEAPFVRDNDDAALIGALSHELEHVRSRDPLRYLLLAVCLRVAPLGERLLGRHAAEWIFSREVQCDRAAVLAGADAFGTARALLQASRFRSAQASTVAPMNGAAAKLRLRIELLLAYAEKRPRAPNREGRRVLVVSMVSGMLMFALPHRVGTAPLDAVHTAVERAAGSLLR